MIREICKDEFFLSLKAQHAAADDLGVAQDLLDTLAAHRAAAFYYAPKDDDCKLYSRRIDNPHRTMYNLNYT